MTAEDKIQKADELFYEIFHDFSMFHYFNPTNESEEREKFFFFFEKGKPYNPVFEYNALPPTLVSAKERLDSLTFGTTELEACFANVRVELSRLLELTLARGTSAIAKHSAIIFGSPGDALVAQAKELLSKRQTKKDPTPQIGVRALEEIVKQKLREDGIEGWDVLEDSSNVAWVETDWAHRKIRVRPGILVDDTLAKRLVHHVVGVHVYRAINGERQPYRVFAIGLDQSLEAEEGLATLLEERMGLLTPYVLDHYAARVIAASLVPTASFQTIFSHLVKCFSEEDAYTITERCKRGLVKTEEPGGLVRDHIHLAGREKIRSLQEDEIRLLYIGKVGLAHLPLIKKMRGEQKLLEPSFVPMVFYG